MFQNSGINKVILVGRINGEPIIKTVNNERFVCFQLVTVESFFKQGTNQEHSEYHQIRVPEGFTGNNTAELQEGAEIYLEGKISTIPSVDSAGIRRYDTTVVVTKYSFMARTPREALQHQ
jgi:single stranded DNA-binding protein